MASLAYGQDLTQIDHGMIVWIRRIEHSIYKIALAICLLWAAVAKVFQNYMNSGQVFAIYENSRHPQVM